MRYTEKEIRQFLGQKVCIAGFTSINGKRSGRFSYTGILVQYGAKKYGVEYVDWHGQKQVGTFKTINVDHIIEVC